MAGPNDFDETLNDTTGAHDNLVANGAPKSETGSLSSVDKLVEIGQADPILSALQASGFTTLNTGQLPPGVQPLSGGPVTSPAQAPPADGGPVGSDTGGPITSPGQVTTPGAGIPPSQVPGTPQVFVPANNRAGAPQIPVRPGDVASANANQEAQLNNTEGAAMDAALAHTNALTEHANSRANVYEGHATAQALVDQQYEAARLAARNDANAETAAWMRDLDKKVAEEPVPGRWWDSQSSFSKVMHILSLTFGAMAQAKNPNLKNIGLEMITKEVDADIAAQRARIDRQIQGLKVKGDFLEKKHREQLADLTDDHTMVSSRLAMVQQAALERANAPGAADVKEAMMQAAQWAGQQRLEIAGQRANRAYAEREGQLNRDAENARAALTDKRDRDIAAANIQKDYDLARIQAGVKLASDRGEALKDVRSISSGISGIRVTNSKGEDVNTAITQNGDLAVNKEREGDIRKDVDTSQQYYARLHRVSKALSSDDGWDIMFRKDPQLVSDLQTLGYQEARSNDPRGIVTDKDFESGMQTALGGDLNSLKGRIAAGTFGADRGAMKKLIDKHIADFPTKMSIRFGKEINTAIPGYGQKDTKIVWTPVDTEADVPADKSTQETDASYGIKTPIKAPDTLSELQDAQALEKKGVKALPPYRPGSQDRVLQAINDFKGATPESIQNRAGKVEAEMDAKGDRRASLEVQQAQYKSITEARKRLDDIDEALQRLVKPVMSGPGGSVENRGYDARYFDVTKPEIKQALERKEVPIQGVIDLAKAKGITQLTGQDVLDIIKRAGLTPYKE